MLGPGLYIYQQRVREATCHDAEPDGYVLSFMAAIDGIPGATTMTMQLVNTAYFKDWTLKISGNQVVGDSRLGKAADGPDATSRSPRTATASRAPATAATTAPSTASPSAAKSATTPCSSASTPDARPSGKPRVDSGFGGYRIGRRALGQVAQGGEHIAQSLGQVSVR